MVTLPQPLLSLTPDQVSKRSHGCHNQWYPNPLHGERRKTANVSVNPAAANTH
jgi:hypothetical protein